MVSLLAKVILGIQKVNAFQLPALCLASEEERPIQRHRCCSLWVISGALSERVLLSHLSPCCNIEALAHSQIIPALPSPLSESIGSLHSLALFPKHSCLVVGHASFWRRWNILKTFSTRCWEAWAAQTHPQCFNNLQNKKLTRPKPLPSHCWEAWAT